ncbi:MAG TPA: SRPBCC family protein [Acidimicrobiales bacterium]|nr:SRPBCC family protein [Acidimicrobiales bacterium]
MRGEARIRVEAPAEKVWDLVADVTRMGEWSPETYRAVWLDGATGPTVGARFRGDNRMGLVKWSTTPTITAATRGEEFAFDTGSTHWRYEFHGREGGCEVTESYETHMNVLLELASRLTLRDRALQRGMQKTLEHLKAAAEAG